jgi:N-methylhydantoinase A
MTATAIPVIASDAGGTMTDMLLVDVEGRFAVGKASTTPQDESVGFWEALRDAAERWGIDWDRQAKAILPGTEAAVYSGTAMLNVLLTRTGRRVGAIVTRGQEDTLLHERGRHIYAGYAYADRLHKVTHQHNVPLVPRRLVEGVTERIDMFGTPVVPLYEEEAREAVRRLLRRGVEGIVVCFLYSYLNPAHERRVADIAREVMAAEGREVPVYLSSEAAPIMREVSRLTSTLLQAYGAEPARRHLFRIEERLRGEGFSRPLQIVLASGGVANIRYPRLHEATFSGPIGGLLGTRYLAQVTGIPNWVATDMGGTSFDVGLIMGGEPLILREVELVHHLFNIPTVVMDSVGAGAGMYLRVDPVRRRLEIGPESAGADPGPVAYGRGNLVPTVMDCCVVLGWINPDYYLGGKLRLDKALALKALRERCAEPLGVDVYEFASGVVDLVNTRMREFVKTVLQVRGFSPSDYCLLAYGGAGPLFMAGYTEGLSFRGVATVPFAAAFSSFGCAAMDYAHRYQKSTCLALPLRADPAAKMQAGETLNAGWEELEALAFREVREEGWDPAQLSVRRVAYVRYGGQLGDLEVVSPVERIRAPEDVDALLAAFEELYGRVYTGTARYPEAGFQILELGIVVQAPKTKPVLRRFPLSGKTPPPAARKGERAVYSRGKWQVAPVYEMDLLEPGNEVPGLAVIEGPATTLFLPQGKKIRVDEFKIFWLEVFP